MVACASGPPCTITSTGRLPVKRAGGKLRIPEIVRPSKLFQRTTRCSTKVDMSTPGALSALVQRCARPLAISMAWIWLGPWLLLTLNARCPVARWNSTLLPTLPAGQAGCCARSLSVSVSNRRSSLRPSTLTRSASVRPSKLGSTPSTFQGMWALSRVTCDVAKSSRINSKNSPARSLTKNKALPSRLNVLG